MDGAFVTYHNTQEIFGFQYIPLSVIDNCMYQPPAPHLPNSSKCNGLVAICDIITKV